MSYQPKASVSKNHINDVAQYYRFHSQIYDATRWSFLFGRTELIKQIPALPAGSRILEVGCGTGKNIIHLKQRFPDAYITGVDISPDMLNKAWKKITDPNVSLKNVRYGSGNLINETYDLIVLSYSMTMMGEEYPQIIARLKNNLDTNGYIAVVDFHTSPLSWFRKWMEVNHVDFKGNLHSHLEENFTSVHTNLQNAYLGLWNYFLFIGKQN